jgi:hypothetical protein
LCQLVSGLEREPVGAELRASLPPIAGEPYEPVIGNDLEVVSSSGSTRGRSKLADSVVALARRAHIPRWSFLLLDAGLFESRRGHFCRAVPRRMWSVCFGDAVGGGPPGAHFFLAVRNPEATNEFAA